MLSLVANTQSWSVYVTSNILRVLGFSILVLVLQHFTALMFLLQLKDLSEIGLSTGHKLSPAAAGAVHSRLPVTTCHLLLQVLCIQGFLACRKHADRVILLVEMMQGSGCPAFKAGPRCVHNLRKRFHLNLTETQVGSLLL